MKRIYTGFAEIRGGGFVSDLASEMALRSEPIESNPLPTRQHLHVPAKLVEPGALWSPGWEGVYPSNRGVLGLRLSRCQYKLFLVAINPTRVSFSPSAFVYLIPQPQQFYSTSSSVALIVCGCELFSSTLSPAANY